MNIKDWLFSSAGAAYLLQEYVAKQRSSYELAKEKLTYPNMIRRALIHHRLELRTTGEASKVALKNGRRAHPTKGKNHDEEVKARISRGVRVARTGKSAGDDGPGLERLRPFTIDEE